MSLLVIVPSILAFPVSFLAFWLLVPLLLAIVFIFAERFPLCAVYLRVFVGPPSVVPPAFLLHHQNL